MPQVLSPELLDTIHQARKTPGERGRMRKFPRAGKRPTAAGGWQL
jgi:hypothetical protein